MIGAGGMGEVYRATDTKLKREVALKILPEAFARDRERMARFEREAQVLASLNHPNIAAIYGLEEQDGTRALVLELVEGATLTERIAEGPIPLSEALAIAKQIAEALEAAHEVGIIHRDVKPANVIANEDGQVKVLDFGLAKALEGGAEEEEAETSPTLSFAATRAGVILGTASYMSPEQARGHKADRRSDIWSFGVVLFEMLSGKRLFTGDTPSDVLAHVLTAKPDWDGLNRDVPPSVRTLLRRCLTRERKSRLQAIGEARIAIEEHLADPDSARRPEPIVTGSSKLPWVVSGLLAVALLASLWFASNSSTDSTSPTRLSAELDSEGVELVEIEGRDGAMAVLSPDGKTVAFVGRASGGGRQIYIRSLDQLRATPLSGTEDGSSPFFSPDGRWLAFFTNGALKKVTLTGGVALTIAEPPSARGGTWGVDGTIVFTPNINTGLYRVPASGGTPVELTQPGDDERSHRWPWFLPDGKAVIFISQVTGGSYDDGNVEAVRLDTGERRVLHRGGTFPRYYASGPSRHLLFARENTVFATPFDADRLDVIGEPTPVLEGVRSSAINGSAQYAFSTGGTLVYARGGSVEGKLRLARADRTGATTMLPADPAEFIDARLSPDETRLAVTILEAPDRTVHVFDLERGTMSRLTFDGTANWRPIWSPDGERIAFASNQHGGPPNIYWTRSDGAGQPERLTNSENVQDPSSFSPDGKLMIYRERSVETGLDVWVLPLDGAEDPTPFLTTPANERDATLSPDGRWIAYASDESGFYQIYVQPFPDPGGKYQVSANEGRSPSWTKAGHELVYIEPPNRWMAVSVSTTGDVFRAGNPELLFEGDFAGGFGGRLPLYDVSADGERFIVFPSPESESDDPLVTFVFDFFDEVRRLTGE